MLSVIIPARNEERAIRETIETIREVLTRDGIRHEVIVVNDGSTDGTGAIARECGARVIDHPVCGGYGRSLKDGILAASYDLIAITDADGTYPNHRLPELYHLVRERGFDMAVGARTGREYRGSFFKMPARKVFLWLSEYASGQKIEDINSGLRVFIKEIPLRYMHTISNGFSFTTTITLAALLNGYFVRYVPIEYYKRVGSSHVRYYRDSLRSLQIIVENILYYNPLKMFLLLVKMLMAVAACSLIGCLVSESPKLDLLFGALAASSFGAAFIVSAMGLHADLSRIVHTTDQLGAAQSAQLRPPPLESPTLPRVITPQAHYGGSPAPPQ